MRTAYRAWRQELGSKRQARALLAILTVGLVVRAAWARSAMHLPPLLTDPTNYYFSGRSLAAGNGYRDMSVFWDNISRAFSGRPTLPLPYTAFYPPGYPFVLGGLFWLGRHAFGFTDLYRLGVYFNVVVGAATVLITFEIMRRLFDVRVGLVTAAIQALYPNLVFHTAQLGYETLFNFLSMLLVLVIVTTDSPNGRVDSKRLVAIAALMGVAVYVRPTVVFFVPALAVVWRLSGATWGRVLRQCGIVGVVVLAMLVPWTIRNIVRMHSPVIVSTGIGPALCASRLPGAHGNYDPAASKRYCDPDVRGVPLDRREVEINNHSTRTAVAFVVHHPISEANQWFWRVAASYGSDHDALDSAEARVSREWLTVSANVADGYYFAVVALALLGARAFATRADPRRVFFILSALSFAVVPVLLYGDLRYKVPILPLLTGMAAVGLVAAWDATLSLRAAPLANHMDHPLSAEPGDTGSGQTERDGRRRRPHRAVHG